MIMFCGNNKKKRLIPAVYMGELRCEIPESGDEFTMYPLGIPNWANYPVSILRAQEGHYFIRGDIVAVEAVLGDQRPRNRKTRAKYRWGILRFKLCQLLKGRR